MQERSRKKMNIRRAKEKDIPKMIDLLNQVLELHANIRPDIFVPGTTKYSTEELAEMLKDDSKPIFAAVDDSDTLIGYAFCQIKEQPKREYMVPFKSIFIDDLCVDANYNASSYCLLYSEKKVCFFHYLYSYTNFKFWL